MSTKKQISKIPTVARRNLIAGLGATALTILIPHNKTHWDFLFDNNFRDYKPDIDFVVKNYVPIGDETEVDEGDLRQKARIEKVIQARLKQEEYDLPKYEIECSSFLFGAPEEIFAENLMQYCKSSCDFMQAKIKGLRNFEFDWVIPRTGDNYRTNFNGKAFIIDSILQASKIKVNDPSNGKELFKFIQVHQLKGGTAQFSFEKVKNNFVSRDMLISTGRSALTSVFSESIGISTAEKMYKHSQNDVVDAVLVNEALHEGIAFVLADEFAKIRKIPNGKEIIEATLSELIKNEPYLYVPQSIKWVRRNGFQQAYDLYMESPEKFFKAINKL